MAGDQTHFHHSAVGSVIAKADIVGDFYRALYPSQGRDFGMAEDGTLLSRAITDISAARGSRMTSYGLQQVLAARAA